MREMGFQRRLLIGVCIILFVIASAYLIEFVSMEWGMRQGKRITVLDGGSTVAYLDSQALKQIAGSEEIGPSLNSVLNAAGVGDFSVVEIKGVAEETACSIPREMLSEDLVFQFGEDGTADLIDQKGAQLLIKNVSEIGVKP